MSKASVALARAVHIVFTQQKQSGSEKFGNWLGRMADAMTLQLMAVYKQGMRAAKVKDDRWVAVTARSQAVEAARQVNEASANMLDLGRDYKEVFSRDRAALIAVDQEQKARMNCQVFGAMSRKNKIRWQCDAKPCRTCLKLNGKTRNPGKMFAVFGGVPILAPPLHPNCLLGETPVIAPDAVLAYKAFYHGTVVRIVTASGDEFTCTAKHQLFGRFGFADAESFVKGDDIGYCPASEQSQPFVGPNDNNVPTTIEEVVAAFAESSSVLTTSVPVSPEYLHGDGMFCQGKIEVVNPNGFLWDEVDTGFGQLLTEPDFQRTLHTETLIADGFLDLGFDRDDLSSSGNIGRTTQFTSIGNRSLAVASNRSLSAASWGDTVLNEMVANNASAGVPSFSQRKFRLPGKVAATKIVSIRKHNFQGHVFDLQTVKGTYIIANAIVSSNCHCRLVEVRL